MGKGEGSGGGIISSAVTCVAPIGEVACDCMRCKCEEALKDLVCMPVKFICRCCPWERILDPVFCIACLPCVIVSRACGGKKKVAPEGGSPPFAELDAPPTVELMERA